MRLNCEEDGSLHIVKDDLSRTSSSCNNIFFPIRIREWADFSLYNWANDVVYLADTWEPVVLPSNCSLIDPNELFYYTESICKVTSGIHSEVWEALNNSALVFRIVLRRHGIVTHQIHH